jgi:hypothetical protein
LKAGVPLATVQKILRHSDPRLTALTYGHLDIDDMRAGMERLEENLKLAYDKPKRSFGANLVPGTFFDLGAGERSIEKDSDFEGVEASGQQDSNLRPSGPKPDALPS